MKNKSKEEGQPKKMVYTSVQIQKLFKKLCPDMKNFIYMWMMYGWSKSIKCKYGRWRKIRHLNFSTVQNNMKYATVLRNWKENIYWPFRKLKTCHSALRKCIRDIFVVSTEAWTTCNLTQGQHLESTVYATWKTNFLNVGIKGPIFW